MKISLGLILGRKSTMTRMVSMSTLGKAIIIPVIAVGILSIVALVSSREDWLDDAFSFTFFISIFLISLAVISWRNRNGS